MGSRSPLVVHQQCLPLHPVFCYPAHRLRKQASLALVPSNLMAIQPYAPMQQRCQVFALHCFLLFVGMIEVAERECSDEGARASALAISTAILTACAILFVLGVGACVVNRCRVLLCCTYNSCSLSLTTVMYPLEWNFDDDASAYNNSPFCVVCGCVFSPSSLESAPGSPQAPRDSSCRQRASSQRHHRRGTSCSSVPRSMLDLLVIDGPDTVVSMGHFFNGGSTLVPAYACTQRCLNA